MIVQYEQTQTTELQEMDLGALLRIQIKFPQRDILPSLHRGGVQSRFLQQLTLWPGQSKHLVMSSWLARDTNRQETTNLIGMHDSPTDRLDEVLRGVRPR